jgi:MarR family transcriptional regulator, organic hydroperoxide resistance regulator
MTSEHDIHNTLERFTRRMFTHLITALAQSLREQDMSVAEIAALHLVDRDRRMSIGDLAVALGSSMPAASRLASGLVDRALLVRNENPKDRRVRLLALSPQGQALIDRTSRERVGAALAAAAGMPGAAPDVFAAAIAELAKRETSSKPKGNKQ